MMMKILGTHLISVSLVETYAKFNLLISDPCKSPFCVEGFLYLNLKRAHTYPVSQQEVVIFRNTLDLNDL